MTSETSDMPSTDTVSKWQDCLDEKRPRVMEAQCLIATPMFIGNGSQETIDVRPSSIKGALRFWWRALQWQRFIGEKRNDVNQALIAMHKAEAELFGSTATDKAVSSSTNEEHTHKVAASAPTSGGQSRFNLDVIADKYTRTKHEWQPGHGIQYLLGQGCYKPGKPGKVTRQSLSNGQSFTLRLSAKPGITAPTHQQWKELEQTLLLWSLLGGLGSRGRKGLGSVSLHSLSGGEYTAPTNETDYIALLQEILKPASSLFTEPPFTALSGLCRLDISARDSDPVTLLDKIGEELQHYRAWGHDGVVGRRTAKQNFKRDHDDGLKAINGETPTEPAKRAVFGLPHNYFFKSIKKKLDISLKVKRLHHSGNLQVNGDRRASPLFIHIHQFPDGKSLAVQLLIPAQFLPAENQQLSYNKNMSVPMPNNATGWNVITRYLDEHFDNALTLVKDGRNSA